MKSFIAYVLVFFIIVSCSKPTKGVKNIIPTDDIEVVKVPSATVKRSKLFYNKNGGLWTLNGKPFSGYAVTYFINDSLQEKIGILNGKRQNESIKWYPSGQVHFIANYHKGKLHGEKKVWFSGANHTLVAHLNFYLGKAQGVQKKWYTTGERYQILNMNQGKEEGIQRAYRKNGDLYANYEAKNGRIFGLKKSALCYQLQDEQVRIN